MPVFYIFFIFIYFLYKGNASEVSLQKSGAPKSKNGKLIEEATCISSSHKYGNMQRSGDKSLTYLRGLWYNR